MVIIVFFIGDVIVWKTLFTKNEKLAYDGVAGQGFSPVLWALLQIKQGWHKELLETLTPITSKHGICVA